MKIHSSVLVVINKYTSIENKGKSTRWSRDVLANSVGLLVTRACAVAHAPEEGRPNRSVQ